MVLINRFGYHSAILPSEDLDDCPVRCFFVFASSTPAPVLRFLDPFSLLDMAPAELKYESIGSSPDMDEHGPMEVHARRCFERQTEIDNSKEQNAPSPRDVTVFI